ncbi:MAG TPA: hypothetical protein VGF76_16360 [Polyangiaceae bacterium]|jgi:predicted Zn-dependent protease
MSISKHGIRTVALAMTAVSLLSTASALACGGDWFPELQIDPRIHGVLEAEKSIAKGNYVAAAGSVVRMMPQLETLDAKRDPLVARAERVLAVAIERSNGKLALEQEVPREYLGHWLGKSQLDQNKNMAWSVSTLRRQLTNKQDDPGVQTELGEALSKLEGGSEEARTLLESLASRDLVATPEGYKALAQLRLEKGDQAGQQLAMKRCESMATSSKVCETDTRRAG